MKVLSILFALLFQVFITLLKWIYSLLRCFKLNLSAEKENHSLDSKVQAFCDGSDVFHSSQIKCYCTLTSNNVHLSEDVLYAILGNLTFCEVKLMRTLSRCYNIVCTNWLLHSFKKMKHRILKKIENTNLLTVNDPSKEELFIYLNVLETILNHVSLVEYIFFLLNLDEKHSYLFTDLMDEVQSLLSCTHCNEYLNNFHELELVKLKKLVNTLCLRVFNEFGAKTDLQFLNSILISINNGYLECKVNQCLIYLRCSMTFKCRKDYAGDVEISVALETSTSKALVEILNFAEGYSYLSIKDVDLVICQPLRKFLEEMPNLDQEFVTSPTETLIIVFQCPLWVLSLLETMKRSDLEYIDIFKWQRVLLEELWFR